VRAYGLNSSNLGRRGVVRPVEHAFELLVAIKGWEFVFKLSNYYLVESKGF
jgi:hypothetical protein